MTFASMICVQQPEFNSPRFIFQFENMVCIQIDS